MAIQPQPEIERRWLLPVLVIATLLAFCALAIYSVTRVFMPGAEIIWASVPSIGCVILAVIVLVRQRRRTRSAQTEV